jgi:DNA repair ATPase RecN
MKRRIQLLLLAAFTIGYTALIPAQDTKPSPAAEALANAAKEMADSQKSFDVGIQQARSSEETTSKALIKQLTDANKSLHDKLEADKKYKPLVDQIDTMQKQIQGLDNDMRTKFTQQYGPIQQKIAADKALIDGLVPIVRKENGWPDSATYDYTTQTWKGLPEKK